jgi:signal transduction histidine kinase
MAVQIKQMESSAEGMQEKNEIKILVVDDREDNLFSIETILEKDNYTTVKATSGRAALKILLQQQDFSLILMDVQMPELNGFETAQIIYEREKLRDIPIIFITAFNYDEDFIFKGYKTGGVDYIYKPIKQDLLRAKVGVFVELYRKNQQLLQHERKLIAANRFLQKQIEERKASEDKIKMLNAKLVENNEQLRATNEELDRFAYVASHDLQEPLRKIMVFSDKILMQGNHDPETEKYFRKIINSSQRMQALINDLLSFSRHSVSYSDFKETDLNKLVREAASELEVEIEKNNASVRFTDLPVIEVAPSLMRQLFYNLISNAIKFRRKEADPVIEIKAEKNKMPASAENKQATETYTITVSDNGIGFDKKYSEEIFQPFKRLHSFHEYEGTGVGLSICKKIVEKHNGTITASSSPGEGSTFLVTVPAKQLH